MPDNTFEAHVGIICSHSLTLTLMKEIMKYIQTQIVGCAFGPRQDEPMNANHAWCGRDGTTELYFRDMDYLPAAFCLKDFEGKIEPDGLFFVDSAIVLCSIALVFSHKKQWTQQGRSYRSNLLRSALENLPSGSTQSTFIHPLMLTDELSQSTFISHASTSTFSVCYESKDPNLDIFDAGCVPSSSIKRYLLMTAPISARIRMMLLSRSMENASMVLSGIRLSMSVCTNHRRDGPSESEIIEPYL